MANGRNDVEIGLSVKAGDTSALPQTAEEIKEVGKELDQVTTKAKAAEKAVDDLGNAKAAPSISPSGTPGPIPDVFDDVGGVEAWKREQMERTRREADDLGRQRNGAGAVTDTPGTTAKDFDAMAAGMRAAKGDGEGLIGMVGRLGSGLSVARVALLGFVGLLGGAALGAIAGFIGWIAKGAAATPQFQEGLARVSDSAKGLGDELNRTAAPLTSFIGQVANSGMQIFSDLLDVARDSIRGFNDAADPTAATARAAEEIVSAWADATGRLNERIIATANELHTANEELAENARQAKLAADAADAQAEANARLKISQIDRAEAEKKITPEEADRQRGDVKAGVQAETDQRAVNRTTTAFDAANAKAIAARKAELAQQAEIEGAEAALRQAENAPRETLDETRARLERERARRPVIAGQVNPIADDEQVRLSNEMANAAPNKMVADLKAKLDQAKESQKQITEEALKTTAAVTAARNSQQLANTEKETNATGSVAEAESRKAKQAEAAAKAAAEAAKKKTAEEIDGLERTARRARTQHERELLDMRQSGATADQVAAKKEANLRAEYEAQKKIAQLKGQDTTQLDADLGLDLARVDAGRDRAAAKDPATPAARVPRAPQFPFARNGGAGGAQRHIGSDRIEIGKGSIDDPLYAAGNRTEAGSAANPRSSRTPNGRDGKDDSAAAKAAGAAAEKTAKALDAVAERFGKSLDGFAAKVDGVGPNIDAASTAITTAIERLDTKIENLKGQIQNTGTD